MTSYVYGNGKTGKPRSAVVKLIIDEFLPTANDLDDETLYNRLCMTLHDEWKKCPERTGTQLCIIGTHIDSVNLRLLGLIRRYLREMRFAPPPNVALLWMLTSTTGSDPNVVAFFSDWIEEMKTTCYGPHAHPDRVAEFDKAMRQLALLKKLVKPVPML